eukprot:EG_transcript_6613
MNKPNEVFLCRQNFSIKERIGLEQDVWQYGRFSDGAPSTATHTPDCNNATLAGSGHTGLRGASQPPLSAAMPESHSVQEPSGQHQSQIYRCRANASKRG